MLLKFEIQQFGVCKYSYSSICEFQNCGVKKYIVGYCGGYVENRFGVGVGMFGLSGFWFVEYCVRK